MQVGKTKMFLRNGKTRTVFEDMREKVMPVTTMISPQTNTLYPSYVSVLSVQQCTAIGLDAHSPTLFVAFCN